MKWCKCRELEMKMKIVLIKYGIEDWYTSFFHFCKWIIFYRNQNIVGKTEKNVPVDQAKQKLLMIYLVKKASILQFSNRINYRPVRNTPGNRHLRNQESLLPCFIG